MSTDDLDALRHHIDAIDHELLALVAARLDIARAIGRTKTELGLPVHQPEREAAMLEDRFRLSRELGLRSEFVGEVLHALVAESRRVQGV